jgi:hypothetical protein
VIDLKGSKPACLANALFQVLLAASLISFLVVDDYNFLTFLTTFLWGFQDSAVNTHSQEILGFEFTEEEN